MRATVECLVYLGLLSLCWAAATDNKTPQKKTTEPKSFTCTFEDDMCNMSHENHSGFYWQRAKGQTPTWDTGPESGHGGKGTYLYAEVSYPQNEGEVALVATEFLRMNQSCLTFWYHAQGQNLGKLEVYLRHGPHENLTATTYLFATGGANYVHEWNQVKANISHVTPGGLIKVTFSATVGYDIHGDYAIDDIDISPGLCPSIHEGEKKTIIHEQSLGLGIVVGACITIVLFIIAAIVVVYLRRRRARKMHMPDKELLTAHI